MALDKEFREFFLRSSKVTSGATPDQEVGYTNTVKVNGVTKYNRFLKDHFPTEGIFTKLFKSIPFFLNKDSTATLTQQGLVKKATDANAESRTSNETTDFTAVVQPHQLPELVLSTDAGDAAVSDTTNNGIKITTLKRTVSGLFRRNYLIEVVREMSIIIDGVNKKLKLQGDVDAPGSNYFYSTNAAGTKGWYQKTIPNRLIKRITANFDMTAAVTAQISDGVNRFEFPLEAGKKYKFYSKMFVLLDAIDGARYNLVYNGGTLVNIKYDISFFDPSVNRIMFYAKKTVLSGNDNFDGFTDGYVVIEGTLLTNTAGSLSLEFATKNGGGNTSRVEEYSWIEIEEIP